MICVFYIFPYCKYKCFIENLLSTIAFKFFNVNLGDESDEHKQWSGEINDNSDTKDTKTRKL